MPPAKALAAIVGAATALTAAPTAHAVRAPGVSPSAARAELVAAGLTPTPLFPRALPARLRDSERETPNRETPNSCAELKVRGQYFQMAWNRRLRPRGSCGDPRGGRSNRYDGSIAFSREPRDAIDDLINDVQTRGDRVRLEQVGFQEVLHMCGHVCGYAWVDGDFTYSIFGQYFSPPRGKDEADMRAVIGKLAPLGPPEETADPGVLPYGGGFLLVGTSPVTAYGAIPIHYSTNLRDWTMRALVFRGGRQSAANPSGLPGWIDARQPLYAPELELIGGRLVVHYSARNLATGKRCIGFAETMSPNSLVFVDRGSPLLCGIQDQLGPDASIGPCGGLPNPGFSLIDPSYFQAGGTSYLLYKRDCMEPPGVRRSNKAIAIRQMTADGRAFVGTATTLLTPCQRPCWEARTAAKGKASVEAPTMFQQGSYYYLLYSGNDYATMNYGIGVARSASPFGPFVKNAGNPIHPNAGGACGVGHQDAVEDPRFGDWLLFYHAYARFQTVKIKSTGDQRKTGRCLRTPRRALHVGRLVVPATGWPEG